MRLPLLVGIVVASLAAGTAFAFYVQGRPADDPHVLRWESPEVEVRIGHTAVPGFEGDPAPLDAAITAALQTWEDVVCSNLSFRAGEPIEDPTDWQHPDDPYLLVYFIVDEPTATTAFALQGSNQRTVVKYWFLYDSETHFIKAATVYLNGYDYPWSTAAEGEAGKLDVQGVVTSMVGRSLGLQSLREGSTTISGGWQFADVSRRRLSRDDVDGVVYLYPRLDCPGCVIVEPDRICLGGGDTCPPSDADAGVSPLADGGPDPQCRAGGDDAGTDGDADGDGDGDGDGDADGDTDGDGDGDGDADADADAGTVVDVPGSDGCCAVAPGAASANDPLAPVVAAALGALLSARRRRSRTSTRRASSLRS